MENNISFSVYKNKKRTYMNINIYNTFGHTAIAKLVLNAIYNIDFCNCKIYCYFFKKNRQYSQFLCTYIYIYIYIYIYKNYQICTNFLEFSFNLLYLLYNQLSSEIRLSHGCHHFMLNFVYISKQSFTFLQ